MRTDFPYRKIWNDWRHLMKNLARKQRVQIEKAFQIDVPGMQHPLGVLQTLAEDYKGLP
jgi:hypothetical protein